MNEDFELTLFDRLEVIRNTITKYGEENFYISFSGGADSTVLHYLIDEALPNNKIPRVFNNTGLEFIELVNFVKDLTSKDNRFVIINNTLNIKETLQEVGYPFKSKEHSHYCDLYFRYGDKPYIQRYLKGEEYQGCPKKLREQFQPNYQKHFSSKCCDMFKKKPLHKWQKENNKTTAILGLRSAEGGIRKQQSSCIYMQNGVLKKFSPLFVVSDEWEQWYIQERNIQLCKLYYPPFNFKRTGCKGCPYSLNLQKDLDTMTELLPNEKKQCEILWKYTYDEYRRLNYRLESQLKLF